MGLERQLINIFVFYNSTYVAGFNNNNNDNNKLLLVLIALHRIKFKSWACVVACSGILKSASFLN